MAVPFFILARRVDDRRRAVGSLLRFATPVLVDRFRGRRVYQYPHADVFLRASAARRWLMPPAGASDPHDAGTATRPVRRSANRRHVDPRAIIPPSISMIDLRINTESGGFDARGCGAASPVAIAMAAINQYISVKRAATRFELSAVAARILNNFTDAAGAGNAGA